MTTNAPPNHRRVLKWVIVGWLGFVALAVIVRLSVEGPAPVTADLKQFMGTKDSKYSPEFADELAGLVKELRETGAVPRIEVANNRAYINPLVWAGLNIDQKRALAQRLAQYCQTQGQLERVDIVDYQSGRELAEYSATFGFEIK